MNEYEFQGRHFIASIYETNVSNGNQVSKVIQDALTLCHASIVGYTEHMFDNGAITFCYLLSESHCTVHTYPEHQSMWLDVFTCGTSFDIQTFQELLINTLHIGKIESTILDRR